MKFEKLTENIKKYFYNLLSKFEGKYSNLTLDELAKEKNVNQVLLGRSLANTLNIKFLEQLDLSLYVLKLSEESLLEIKNNNFFPYFDYQNKQLNLVTCYPYKSKIPKVFSSNTTVVSSLSFDSLINESWEELLSLKNLLKDFPEVLSNALSVFILSLKDSAKIDTFRIEFGDPESKQYFCYTSEGILKGSVSKHVIITLKEFLVDNLQGRRFVDSLNEILKNKITIKITSPISKDSSLSVLVSNNSSSVRDEIGVSNIKLPHILLVDDDERFSDLLRRGISSKGFKVSVAKSVSEAETIISSLDSGLSLIISDLHMPDKSGVSLLRNVKERGVSVPVIILSSDDSTDAQLEILNMGAHAIVAKSSDPRILFAWIYRLIGTSSNPESQVV